MPMKPKEGKTGSDLNLKKTRHSKTASPPTTIRVCISLRTYMTAVSNSPIPHRHASITLCRLRRNILSTAGNLMRCSAADFFGCQLINRVSVSLWERFEENYIIYLTAAKTLRGNFCQNKCRCTYLDKPTVCVRIYLNCMCFLNGF